MGDLPWDWITKSTDCSKIICPIVIMVAIGSAILGTLGMRDERGNAEQDEARRMNLICCYEV
jgi:hypothetical protein